MAHIKRENKMAPLEALSIYAVFALDKSSVFISSCKQGNLRKNYSNHCNLRNPHTADIFRVAKEKGRLPEIYLLQDVICPKNLVYNHYVAWARFFIEHGYKIIPNRKNNVFCLSMSERQSSIYDEIKCYSVDELCGPDKVLYRNYGNKTHRNTGNCSDNAKVMTISVRIPIEQYEKIKLEATKNHRTVAAFCRERILSGRTVNIDYQFAMDFFDELLEDRELLKQILYTIYMRGHYYPADLENIQRLCDDILKNAKEIDKSFRHQVRQLKKTDF